MHPILEASRLMSDAQITRSACVRANKTIIYLWELSTGNTLEVVRSNTGFRSTELKANPFNERVSYYSEKRGAKVSGSYQLQA